MRLNQDAIALAKEVAVAAVSHNAVSVTEAGAENLAKFIEIVACKFHELQGGKLEK